MDAAIVELEEFLGRPIETLTPDLSVEQQAAALGQKVLFLCFTQPLRTWLASRLASEGIEVQTVSGFPILTAEEEKALAEPLLTSAQKPGKKQAAQARRQEFLHQRSVINAQV